ncbi:TetR/AcrR family transcriptional regulator [Devriesea agamarum]|uniref:TetR/AcrR family transcriptional regulator n=1 Tax=Devriesea agamarum TaxID=472569 RepID=UPI00071C3B16|nr:TetR/AcrR family transcriptional regulator [Devriesea agamarum]
MPKSRSHDEALRGDLVLQAAQMLAENGADGLSLRDLASAANTSTTAIYTLFGGKQELIDAVLAEGFASFSISQASVELGDDPRRTLVALSHAYRAWALENPALYGVMFSRPAIEVDPSSVLASTMIASIGPLREACELLARAADENTDEDPNQNTPRRIQTNTHRFQHTPHADSLARTLWAALHGWVELERQGLLGGPLDPFTCGTTRATSENYPDTDTTFEHFVAGVVAGLH